MHIVSYNDCHELDAIEGAWEHLSQQELKYVPSFSELRHHLQTSDLKFRVLVAVDNSQITAVACFIYHDTNKSYEIATRRLFSLPVKELSLFGSCVLGQPSEDIIRKFFQLIIAELRFDIINLGRILVDTPLYNAVTSLRHGTVASRVTRKIQPWWLIRLPRSFDEYLASLSATTRRSFARDGRHCEKEAPDFRVMQRPEDVEKFLLDAEKISRLTYQWGLGYGTRNDEHTQRRLIRLAKNGLLRCYILYLRGAPCAFGWGELVHRTFVFEQTGYDPQYRKVSPGTALILRMIRDLIENTDCEIFDFKWGGDDGYKARFGNVSFSCVAIQLAQIYRPYSLLIVALDEMLNLFKKVAGSIIEHGAVKRRLRTVLRRYGIGTF